MQSNFNTRRNRRTVKNGWWSTSTERRVEHTGTIISILVKNVYRDHLLILKTNVSNGFVLVMEDYSVTELNIERALSALPAG